MLGNETAHIPLRPDSGTGPVSNAARRRSNHAGGDKVSEAIVRCVEWAKLGDWATSICDDDFFTGLDAIDVLAETVLQIADPHFAPRSSYVHDFIVATSTTLSTDIPRKLDARPNRSDQAITTAAELLEQRIAAPIRSLAVLLMCEQLNDDTDGAFDAFNVPAPNGSTLDPSGLVKGWSIERAAHVFERHGHRNFTINAGGDIVVRGQAGPHTPWSVGVRHSDDRDLLAMVLDVTGPAAVATSATYERGAHIIDPRTGQATTELASATVVGPDLAWVDAYATAIFVMGLDGLGWIAEHAGYEAMAITHDATVISTPGFAGWRHPAAAT